MVEGDFRNGHKNVGCDWMALKMDGTYIIINGHYNGWKNVLPLMGS